MDSAVRDRSSLIRQVTTGTTITRLAELADTVYVDRAIVRYVSELAGASREIEHVKLGLSARGALAFIRAAKAWAAGEGRSHVTPQDIIFLADPVLSHRIMLNSEAAFAGISVAEVVEELMGSIRPPEDRSFVSA